MTEGITYKDDGTIAIRLDKTYRLRVPMGEEVMDWHEQLLSHSDEVQDRLDELTDILSATDEGTPEHREAAKALRQFSRRPAYGYLIDGRSSDIYPLIARLLEKDCKIRVARKVFTAGKREFAAGGLILP